jgi:cell division protein FtsB
VSDLTQQVNKLKATNARLKEEIAKLTDGLEKKTRECKLYKQTAYLNKNKGVQKDRTIVSEVDVVPAPNPRQSVSTFHHQQQQQQQELPQPPPIFDNSNDSTLVDVARNYKQKLTAAEHQISQLKREVSELRARLESMTTAVGNSKKGSNNEVSHA